MYSSGMQAVFRALRVHLVLVSIFLLGAGRGIAAADVVGKNAGVADADVLVAERAFATEVEQAGGPSQAKVLATLSGVKVQKSILDAISRPAEETKAWKDYRPIFLTDKRIDDGIAFQRGNHALLDRIGAEYGVPPEIIVAIIGVETGYVRNTWKYRVLDSLGTLAFHYPPRAAFFRGELKQLFLLGDKQLAYPIEDLRGSYAGAMGWGQFMPTSVAKWAKDEDGDGRIDLWNSLPDITASVANYFAEHGWQKGAPVAVPAQVADDARALAPANAEPLYPLLQMEALGYAPMQRVADDTPSTLLKLDGASGPEYWITFKNFQVIQRYNKSPMYAMAVWQLAQAIAAGASSSP